ncbi:type II toxin-antitoxin system ParD family antitoxin [Caulobacter sp. DWR1-3-2b1]|uniref:type II toxin-antitoxin system ParD family antitoxin n=1 Tax=Caulobacter sp. DWR1-3-2b1 TaxID=2804670 RepID=UPI003CED0B31
MSLQVQLPPALEKFAQDCIAEGRYDDVDAVVKSGLRLLQVQEERRRRLNASLDEAIAESDRDGYVTMEQMMAEMDAIIEAAEAAELLEAK